MNTVRSMEETVMGHHDKIRETDERVRECMFKINLINQAQSTQGNAGGGGGGRHRDNHHHGGHGAAGARGKSKTILHKDGGGGLQSLLGGTTAAANATSNAAGGGGGGTNTTNIVNHVHHTTHHNTNTGSHYSSGGNDHDEDRFVNLENSLSQMRDALMEPLREVKMEVESIWHEIRVDKDAVRVRMEEFERTLAEFNANATLAGGGGHGHTSHSTHSAHLSPKQQFKRATNKLSLINALSRIKKPAAASGDEEKKDGEKKGEAVSGNVTPKARSSSVAAAAAASKDKQLADSAATDVLSDLPSKLDEVSKADKPGSSRMSLLANLGGDHSSWESKELGEDATSLLFNFT
jgi:hypothetical protein